MNNRKFDPTTVNEYFAWLEENVDQGSALYRSVHGYMEFERTHERREEEDAPFLSVITRTQGKRPEMLRETLLCLTAQCNTDFELLIMGHNLSDEQNAVVCGILDELPVWMRSQTRLIPVSGGTRTTPLNAGFEAARGRYAAVLDDDDLVFDHWVDAFYRLSLENEGRILHQYTTKQDWETLGGDMADTPRAVHAFDDCYCRDFQLLGQMIYNTCPPCTLAFPLHAFRDWGIRFDETLTTTEDWDFMMRCAFLTGVANGDSVTSLYRNWINAENSQTVHSKDEWAENYRSIVNKFVKTPVVMPADSLKGIVDVRLTQPTVTDDGYTDQIEETLTGVPFEPTLYYSDCAEFHEVKRWLPSNDFDRSVYRYAFCAPEGSTEKVYGIRFVPQETGLFALHDYVVCVEQSDGTMTYYSPQSMGTNAFEYEGSLYFFKNRPRVDLYFDKSIDIKRVMIACRIEHSIPDEIVDLFTLKTRVDKSSFYKFFRMMLKKIKK